MSARLASVVMPVYNGERFLAAAVESVLRQTHRRLQLIAVDDGSTDRSSEILADAARRDDRVIVHRQPVNGGVVAARNAAFARAEGEVVFTLDCDDVCLPTRVERQFEFLDAHPDVGVVGALVQRIDADDRLGRVQQFPSGPGLVAWSLLFLNPVAHSASAIRRSIWERVGPYDEAFRSGAEDYDWFERASHVTRIANLSDVLVHYRTWPGSMTRQTWDRLERNATRIAARLASSLAEMEVSEARAHVLRGLVIDRFPTDLAEIAALGDLIENLLRGFVARKRLDARDIRDVRMDAGMRLHLLAALALRKSPKLAARFAARATAISPRSVLAFTAKAIRRIRPS